MTFTFTLTSRRIIALLGFLNIALVATLLFTSVKPSLADQPDPLPPPLSVGTNIPASYFGPMPSEVQKGMCQKSDDRRVEPAIIW